MSHSLYLVSKHDELELAPTNTAITYTVMSAGSPAAGAVIYGEYLDMIGWDGWDNGGLSYAMLDEWAPGWSWDPLTRHLAMVDTWPWSTRFSTRYQRNEHRTTGR